MNKLSCGKVLKFPENKILPSTFSSLLTPSFQTPLKLLNMLNPNYQTLPLNSLHLVN